MIVISYPKSGRTWLLHMLADYYGYFFANKDFTERGKRLLKNATLKPRNWVSGFHDIDVEKLKVIKKTYEKKCIYLVRDPRDCLTSYYFYRIYPIRNRIKRYLKLIRVNRSKKRFMEKFLLGWVDHVDKYIEYSDEIVRFEDLLSDTFMTMRGFIDDADDGKLQETIQKFDFENITKRKPGIELRSAFARKGIRGDWLNHFGDYKSKRTMKPIINSHLLTFGYESTRDW